MIEDQLRIAPNKLPSVEDAAADILRLTAALATRREAAPDNLVELAALAVALQRGGGVATAGAHRHLGLSRLALRSHSLRCGRRTASISFR